MTSIQNGRQNIKQNIWLITLLRSIQNHRCSFFTILVWATWPPKYWTGWQSEN